MRNLNELLLDLDTLSVSMNMHILCDMWYLFAELEHALREIKPALEEKGVQVFIMSKECPVFTSFTDKVESASDSPISRSCRSQITFKSPAVYIYTSGTTGRFQ